MSPRPQPLCKAPGLPPPRVPTPLSRGPIPPPGSSEEVSPEQESEDTRGIHGSLEGQGQHRANTTAHVCWYRNTSVSRADHSTAVEVGRPQVPSACAGYGGGGLDRAEQGALRAHERSSEPRVREEPGGRVPGALRKRGVVGAATSPPALSPGAAASDSSPSALRLPPVRCGFGAPVAESAEPSEEAGRAPPARRDL